MKPRAFCSARALGAVLVLLFAEFAGAQITITANTNWGAISSGSGPAGQPSTTDAIIVKNGATLTVDVSNGQCASLALGQDGADAGAGTLWFNAGSLVECGGDVIVGTTAPDHAGTVTMTAGGTLTISGALLLTAGQSTFTAGNGTVAFNGSAAQTIAATTYHHLTYSGTATATLAGPTDVTGDLTIASGTLASGNQAFTVAGHWSNHGTFTPGTATVTFTGTGTVNVTGSATTAFNNVTVNLGSSASVLEVLAPITLANNGLTLTQGTFKLSSASTITPFSGSETIPAGAGFHLNHASALSNWGSSGSLTLNGKLIVDHGSMNIGSSSGNQLTVSGASSEVTLNGGTLTLAGRISVTSSGAGNGLTISGGEMVVTTAGNNSASAPNFNLGATGKFTMTGGLITCERANSNAGGAELVIASGSGAKSITGGTIRIGNASTPAAQTIEINSAVPIFHFTVNSANATAQLVNTPLTVNGDLLISAGTLDANNLNLELAGNWTNNGTFVPGTGTVIMNGSSPQNMSGSTFHNLAINNASGVTLLTDETVNNTLSLLNGNVTTGSNRMIITAGGTVARTSGHIAGNLQKHFAAGSNVVQTFEVGTGSDYTPVEVTIAQVNNSGNVTAKSTSGDHASIGTSTLDATRSVNRNWALTSDGALTLTNYDVTFNFVAGDLDGGANPSNLIVGKLDAGTWTYPAVGTRTATSTQATGMTSFSDFQLAECTPPSVNFSSVGPFCVTDAAVDLTAFVSPSGGTFSGNGVTSAGIFTPSDAGTGTHTITYTFTSGGNCTNSASQNIVVNPLPSVAFNAVSAVCVNTAALDLTSYVSPSGGTFSGNGVTSAGVFTPSDAGTGTHTITYTFTSGGNCTNSASQNIVVNPLPSVGFNAVSAVCVNTAALDLTSYVSPSGGT
ncbi:hypothetical protein L6R21_08355, partial [bacterium]|nr:hypothetical protein [bacterium]